MATRQMRMSGQDWAILLILSVLWGGSFFFIEVAIETVAPFTLVLIRVVHRRGAASGCGWLVRRERLPMPPGAACAFLVLALLNNVIPFVLFAWAQEEITGGLASILNATTPIWGVIVAHLFTADEKATPGQGRRRAARLRRRGGDDRRRFAGRDRPERARPARLPGRDALLRAGRRLGAPLPRAWACRRSRSRPASSPPPRS